MSTILDALRKAQDETTSGVREVRGDELRAPGEPVVPRRERPRRALVWLAGIAGVLALAFVGGLALGNRVSDLFLGGNERGAVPAVAEPAKLPAEARELASVESSAIAEPREQPAVPPPAAPSAAAPEQREAARPPKPAVAMPAQPAAEAPVPTPYGRLHVFGAADAPASNAEGGEDRAARLRQLREKMLKARREVADRSGGRPAEPPTAIVIPPPPGVATGAAAPALAPAAAPQDVGSADAEPMREVARSAAPAPGALPAEAPAERGAIGVSVGAGQAQNTGGEIRDPDIVMLGDEAMPEPAPAAPPEPAPAVVASVPRQDPAQAGAPPVLRRAPGGAPQVSINILQWSVEPGRRFAFVSVDGGGMTQVREGDRIGGLTVKQIHQQMIEFGFNDSSFLLRAN